MSDAGWVKGAPSADGWYWLVWADNGPINGPLVAQEVYPSPINPGLRTRAQDWYATSDAVTDSTVLFHMPLAAPDVPAT